MISPQPPLWREKAREALFGRRPVAHQVILTPFAAVLDAAGGKDCRAGWWRVTDARGVTLVQVPQGSAAIDAVMCMEPGTRISFVGSCGVPAYGSRELTGTIVEAAEALAFDGTAGQRTWPGPFAARPVTVATVRCLADSTARHRELQAACADMETAWILAAAQAARVPARALLAVTDMNRDGAVFDTDFPVVTALLRQAADIARRSCTIDGRHKSTRRPAKLQAAGTPGDTHIVIS